MDSLQWRRGYSPPPWIIASGLANFSPVLRWQWLGTLLALGRAGQSLEGEFVGGSAYS